MDPFSHDSDGIPMMATTDPNSRNTTWSYLVDFLGYDRSAWDRGVLDAHWYTAAPTSHIQANLILAKKKRRRILAIISSWRRHYLNGLIWGYEKELERRVRVEEN
ncbi:hypothetical protein [Singulisphaera acidiphila]|uniref:Uncharacterized protein n=1 Tax=Singulisphaera acidiphila (strain ATCC BAA-1392 / DSM 18658 / VKM B-2454 / MOB10) TaxID=886293 RepID=L0DNN0_SINAD|nr:hypothetical protein [Singulisphaera acidiphila]AGA30857.1 hypothetical protein Sinac_6791 [Singulisphaera acidiphila DSM 18658]